MSIPDNSIASQVTIEPSSNIIATYSPQYKITHIPINIGMPITTTKIKLTLISSHGDKYILNEFYAGLSEDWQFYTYLTILCSGSSPIQPSPSCTPNLNTYNVLNIKQISILDKSDVEVLVTTDFKQFKGQHLQILGSWSLEAECAEGFIENISVLVILYISCIFYKVLCLIQKWQRVISGHATMAISRMKMTRNLFHLHL